MSELESYLYVALGFMCLLLSGMAWYRQGKEDEYHERIED